jgi:hypothetical protein
MKPVGELYQLKAIPEEISSELIPSFSKVIKSWIDNVRETKFADPNYVISITKLTVPLKLFVEKIIENLGLSIIGGSIKRGFGFGKTHTFILLWHIFTSDVYTRLEINIPSNLVRETLVLGLDCTVDRPLAMIVDELRTYSNLKHDITKIKDSRLIMAVSDKLSKYKVEELYDSEKLAKIIAEILSEYRRRGGRPKLLLLIDELGLSLSNKLTVYADRASKGRIDAEEAYVEALSIVNFLDYLYSELTKESLPAVVLWIIAGQDEKSIESLQQTYTNNTVIIDKIKGLIGKLNVIDERYSRGLGGMSMAELTYNPDHAIEIAIYRILEPLKNVDIKSSVNTFIDLMKSKATMLNLIEDFRLIEADLRKYYPLSHGIVVLLRKLMSLNDMPKTEYVRTVIQVVAEVARVALKGDPQGSYVIGLKHLALPFVVQAKLMEISQHDWVELASDLEKTLERLEGDDREAAEIAAKYILAKGVTDRVFALESSDRGDVERYGSTINEIQLEIISSYVDEAKLTKLLDKAASSIELIKVESGRISERDVDGKRFYMPTILKTLYNELAKLIQEESKVLDEKAQIPVYILSKGTIPSLFTITSVKRGDAGILMLDSTKVKYIDTLLSDPTFREAQNKGITLIIIIPPWDLELFREMYEKGSSYDGIAHTIAKRIQDKIEEIGRPLHIIILVPNLSEHKINSLMKKLVVREGTWRFLNLLDEKKRMIESMVKSYIDTIISKRRDLIDFVGKKLEAGIRNKLEKEINDAKDMAQRQLVRLTRDMVQEVISLYGKAVYFNLDATKFDVRDLRAGFQQLERAYDTYDIMEYRITLNMFLDSILEELGYIDDVERVANAIKEYIMKIKEHIMKDVKDEIKVKGIADIENALMGVYGVKPLSSRVVIEALKKLDGEVLEINGIKIKLKFIEEKKLLEAVYEEVKKTKVETKGIEMEDVSKQVSQEVFVRPEDLLYDYAVELPIGFNAEELRSKLEILVNKVELSHLELEFSARDYSLILNVEKPAREVLNDRYVRTFINLISRKEEVEGLRILLKLKFSKGIQRHTLKEILGDYFEATRSSFDKILG